VEVAQLKPEVRKLTGATLRGYGVDDITLAFDLAGSRSVYALNDRPYRQTSYGRMLGDRASWGSWSHLLGRSVSLWKPDTARLYVQAKLADRDGVLTPPADLAAALDGLYERMAVVGIDAYDTPWVTRVDVAVDIECASSHGRTILQGLASSRLPNGWRVQGIGHPMSTVYFRPRGGKSNRVLARAYCRNLKIGKGDPFGWIRLEAQDRFKWGEVPLDYLLVNEGAFLGIIWNARYGKLQTEVLRMDHENQLLELAGLVEVGKLNVRQVDRMHAYLDAERLGVAERLYGRSDLYRRRSEARTLGLAIPDAPGDRSSATPLSDLLAPFRSVWEG
jgi:hypothetical protein